MSLDIARISDSTHFVELYYGFVSRSQQKPKNRAHFYDNLDQIFGLGNVKIKKGLQKTGLPVFQPFFYEMFEATIKNWQQKQVCDKNLFPRCSIRTVDIKKAVKNQSADWFCCPFYEFGAVKTGKSVLLLQIGLSKFIIPP